MTVHRLTYIIRRKFAAAHQLESHEGRCKNLHGHTWQVEAHISVPGLNPKTNIGMDFSQLKALIDSELPDHSFLNEVFISANPSAEVLVTNIAMRIQKRLDEEVRKEGGGIKLRKFILWESDDCAVQAEIGEGAVEW